MFKSPMHKAVKNSETERMTLAMFRSPDAENEIEPVKELVDDKRPRYIIYGELFLLLSAGEEPN